MASAEDTFAKEREEIWRRLTEVKKPADVSPGFFYAPYVPLIKNRAIVTTDVC